MVTNWGFIAAYAVCLVAVPTSMTSERSEQPERVMAIRAAAKVVFLMVNSLLLSPFAVVCLMVRQCQTMKYG